MAQRRAGSEGIRHAGTWLIVIRLVVGAGFLKASVAKIALVWVAGVLPLPVVTEEFLRAQPKRVAELASQNPVGWYKDFLERVVIPHAPGFATLQAFGELGVGVGVLFGLFTSFCALVGLFLTANYLLAAGWTGPALQAFNQLLLVCLAAIFMARAGRSYGLDGWLRRHYPQAWFVRLPLLT